MEAITETQETPKIAYVFPGQGAQFVGMGKELYESSRVARDIFDEVDEILSIPMTKLIFEGPDDQLRATVNSQPAIMATSLACLKVIEEFHHPDTYLPAALAGHSVGEYTSLVASGVLGLADGIRLVRERGRLMQEASELRPGSMAAIIGLDEITLEEICHETGAEIANINGGNQIVVSGTRLCVARAIDMASIRGARKAIPLAVSGAFHSSLMSHAQEGLAAAMEEIDFRDPAVPIFSNVTSAPLTTAAEVKSELLVQLCSCVLWKQSVGNMIDSGVSRFIEFGPGRVLGGLIKRISAAEDHGNGHVDVLSVGDLASARNLVEAGSLTGCPANPPLAT
jgi:[acyl-carrier-protein] S-malonyltransferase